MERKMRKLLCLVIAAALMAGALLLPGCSTNSRTIRVFNWGQYIGTTTNKDFEKATGIRVIYKTYTTNEDMYAILKSGGSTYDVVIPSDYMISRMIEENMLEKLDYANIPNFSLIDPVAKGREYDPKNEYSVAYMWGTVGILYNKKMVSDPVDSWGILWNEKYSGKIFMMDSQRDSIAVALLKLGYDVNTVNAAEIAAAGAELMKQKKLVLGIIGDEVRDKMENNEAAMAVMYSGDAVTTMAKNPDLAYVIPKEGGNIWFDAMVIPKGSTKKADAEAYINFMSSTDAGLANVEEIGYSTPQTEVLKQLPAEIRNNPVAYPPKDVTARLKTFIYLSSVMEQYDRIWTDVTSK
jgi:spermidine/putrescine transport system substrate-binding protein